MSQCRRWAPCGRSHLLLRHRKEENRLNRNGQTEARTPTMPNSLNGQATKTFKGHNAQGPPINLSADVGFTLLSARPLSEQPTSTPYSVWRLCCADRSSGEQYGKVPVLKCAQNFKASANLKINAHLVGLHLVPRIGTNKLRRHRPQIARKTYWQ